MILQDYHISVIYYIDGNENYVSRLFTFGFKFFSDNKNAYLWILEEIAKSKSIKSNDIVVLSFNKV